MEGITLWLSGGVSRLGGEVPDPAAEVRIAGVGPLTSLVLGGVFFAAAAAMLAACPAAAEARQVVIRDSLRGVRVWQIMTRIRSRYPRRSASGSSSTTSCSASATRPTLVTSEEGTVIGLVSFNWVKQVPAAGRARTRLADVSCPLTEVATASPGEPVADLVGPGSRPARWRRNVPGSVRPLATR